MSNRSIPNQYPDYHGEQLLSQDEKLLEKYGQPIKLNLQALLQQLEASLKTANPGSSHGGLFRKNDYSVYTGYSGLAMLYLHLHRSFPESGQAFLETAVLYLRGALKRLGSGVYTFMCGDAGVLALAAVAFSRQGDAGTSNECLKRLESLSKEAVKICEDMPDEHLYGSAGYLAALMYVQTHLGTNSIQPETIRKIVRAMLASGRDFSRRNGWESRAPLMYAWYNELYLGAAHGLAGILYTLMLTRQDPELQAEIDQCVPPTIDFLLQLQMHSGNFPAVVGEKEDRLVHWCHGAPGWASMLALAYQTYNKPHYLEAAERCCEVVWLRGLLKKGYGLCHGAAGNAYAFLALFRLTRNQKHLYRAYKFAEWCCDYGKHGCKTPDTPLSMFEGMAGTLYFLADILEPLKARFPAYEY